MAIKTTTKDIRAFNNNGIFKSAVRFCKTEAPGTPPIAPAPTDQFTPTVKSQADAGNVGEHSSDVSITLATGASIRRLGGFVLMESPSDETTVRSGELSITGSDSDPKVEVSVDGVCQTFSSDGTQVISTRNGDFTVDGKGHASKPGTTHEPYFDGDVLKFSGSSMKLPVPTEWLLSNPIPQQNETPKTKVEMAQERAEVSKRKAQKFRERRNERILEAVSVGGAIALKTSAVTVAGLAAGLFFMPGAGIVATAMGVGLSGFGVGLLGGIVGAPHLEPETVVRLAACAGGLAAVGSTGPIGVAIAAAVPIVAATLSGVLTCADQP